jgi:GTPase SAR1 family protein
MTVDGTPLTIVLWDLYGEDEFQKLRSSYLRGSSGYLLVLDGMRRATLDIALHIQQRATDTLGPVPFVVLINKDDRRAEWDITDQDLAQLAQQGWSFMMSSAKTGQGVEEAFTTLARAMLATSKASPTAEKTNG